MLTILSRIIYYGFKNFWRNGLLSTAMIAIMTISLLVFTGLIVANVSTNNMIGFLKDKIDISVYFKNTAPEDTITGIRDAIKSLPEVKTVEYISSDKALELFRAEHANDPTITQSLDQLTANPFQAALNIKAYSPDQYAKINQYLQAGNLQQYIDSVSFAKNEVVINRLTAIINGVNRVGLILTIILSLIAGLVVFNTVRLAIYSNRDEIGVMRLVGASNIFVRGPYLIEGVIAGFVSAIFSTILLAAVIAAIPLFFSSSSYLDISVPGFSLTSYVYSNLFTLFLYQLLFGIGVATLSSFIAVRRYLKN